MTENLQEKVVLTGLTENLQELKELALTANCKVCGSLYQNRDKPHPKTYIGKGKLEELKSLIQNSPEEITGIICDDELSGIQLKNLSTELEIKVMDRTMVILDIFASNAKSAEGIAQVEIAQQRYNLTRLIGLGTSLSRLGGGIGTRGPGEKKLEMDRRVIRNRIADLEKELKAIKTHRDTLRKARLKNNSLTISLVGYTNAGKSTLMNAFTKAGILSENKLFSTLDTTTRKFNTGGIEVLLTDTVGFIEKLPHSIISAFRSTLEELKYAHILLHVVDCSNPCYENQMKVVYETLKELECSRLPVITVFNKIDKTEEMCLADPEALHTIGVSAKTGQNLTELSEIMEKTISSLKKQIALLVPYHRGDILNMLHNQLIIKKEYEETGVYLEIYADDKIFNFVEKFLCYTNENEECSLG